MGRKTAISYNVNALALRNEQRFRTHMEALRPSWVMIRDSGGMAIEYANKPYTEGVILRTFDPFGEYSRDQTFDNAWWQNHSPQTTVQAMNATLPSETKRGDIYHIFGINEPSSSQGNRAAFAQWLIDYMDLARANGWRLCVGEIAVAKTLNPENVDEISAGVWDDFLRALQRHDGYHILGIHEYTTGWLPASQMTGTDGYPRNLDDFDALRDQNLWYPKLPIDRVNGKYPGNWHLGRVNWLLKRADEIGVSRPQFVVTECAYDYMADIDENHSNWFRDNIVSQYKTERYDIRGVLGHERYHRAVLNANGLPGHLWESLWGHELYKQHRWLADAYTDECKALLLFTWDQWWDTSGYRGFDMSVDRMEGWRAALEKGEAARAQDVKEDEPEPEQPMEPVNTDNYGAIVASVSVNIRTAPTVNSTVVNVIPAGNALSPVWFGDPIEKESYGVSNLWTPYRNVPDGDVRWIASHYITATEFEDEQPEPTPEPDPTPEPEPPQGERRAYRLSEFELMLYPEQAKELARLFEVLTLLFRSEGANVDIATIDSEIYSNSATPPLDDLMRSMTRYSDGDDTTQDDAA